VKQERKKRGPGSWEAMAADLSFFAGVLSALLGCGLTAGTWILGADLHPRVRALGTALLVLTIPLLIFAGYCLDWMEAKVKARANKNSRGG
jgi:hypothetical protein